MGFLHHIKEIIRSCQNLWGQALLESMPVRPKSGLYLEIKIRPDPSSAFKRLSHYCPSLICLGRKAKDRRSKSVGNDAIPVYFTHTIRKRAV